ncbi:MULTISPECIES: hypothetical protein [unclassified Streptomyces]|uniref:hypothetical protein n=1 Tax=unclassified Streptomyces TaxID=2593676 RepID=UPI002E2AAEB5|nr:hypothetical protein [Streptomyces sp. NBC_00228]
MTSTPCLWQPISASAPAGSRVSACELVVGSARTWTWAPHVPYHEPERGTAPGTFSERTSVSRALYAAPNVVPCGCSVKTATIERSPAPTVPVVCSAGLAKSTPAPNAVVTRRPKAEAVVSAQSPLSPKPDQPCLTAQGCWNDAGMPNRWSKPSTPHRVESRRSPMTMSRRAAGALSRIQR